ncbi:hypothetical protein [Pseudaminobacter sp. NGMCC 1.201702]|uniref:hypothetical protein n=1 Tax=Pseudaminobacter sp. NGMCC 1.201702 TaxID=3391825 RepID=UPI0039EEBD76
MVERRKPPSDLFPYPPRGMSRIVAARYIGVGPSKFDEMVRDGRMPAPKRIDGRVVWDRWKLDEAFSFLPEDQTKIVVQRPRSHMRQKDNRVEAAIAAAYAAAEALRAGTRKRP